MDLRSLTWPTWQHALLDAAPAPPVDPARRRRRRVVTALTLLVGAVVLGLSLRIEPGAPLFYPATLALAGVWVVGAFASGPLRLGRVRQPGSREPVRPVVTPVALGLLLAGVFVVGALVVRELPVLGQQVQSVIQYADDGSLALVLLVTVVNGVAEELFFRGALFAAIPRHRVAWTTAANVAVVLATGNVMLAFAAALLGVLVGLQRRASGGILAPVLTHVTWSTTMLLVLPLLFD